MRVAFGRGDFERWCSLTGRSTLSSYTELLRISVPATGLPVTLVAFGDKKIIGSANLVDCDLPICAPLTPWLGQLYVFPEARNHGVGTALVRAATEEAKQLGWRKLYLYTSGTLPEYYVRLGWQATETAEYQGRERIVMEIDTNTVRHD